MTILCVDGPSGFCPAHLIVTGTDLLTTFVRIWYIYILIIHVVELYTVKRKDVKLISTVVININK